MYVLAIETTGAFASVALTKDDNTISRVTGNDRFSHLQNLMPQVEDVVKNSKLSLNDVDVIAVSCGPGSFTGIRIGVSSGRALSQMLKTPCVAVSSLEALALRGAEYAKARAEEGLCPLLICPMLDARRNQVYAGGYYIEDGYPVEVVKAGPYMLDEFLELCTGHEDMLILGDAVDKYGQMIMEERAAGVEFAPEEIRYQDAESVALVGGKTFREKGGLSYEQLEPEYMRMAEAERKLKEQQKGR